jgi:glycosyltransferase involved in cell wall biosynthesis
MSGEDILVSIVLPTYNRTDRLKRAVDSVLRQERDLWELIIVNDGEEDVTRILPDHPKIRLVRNERHIGAAASRNRGIGASGGAFIAYLDDDDEWYPHHLSIDRRILLENDFIYSGSVLADEKGVRPWYDSAFSWAKLAQWNFIPTPCVVHSRSLIERRGGWREDLPCLQDWELWCRLLLSARKVHRRDERTAVIHMSPGSITETTAGKSLRSRVKRRIQMRYGAFLLLRHLARRVTRSRG